MSSRELPWILGISASHNGAVCLLKGDEIVVAVQEERLSRIKRHRVYGSEPSQALAYCLSYAGIEPCDLSLIVLCIQGRASDASHDIRLNPFLEVIPNNIRTLTIPHHYGHALSALATSGFKEAAILVVDGAGSPFEDLTPAEQKVVVRRVEDGWETISLYAASDTSIIPLEKHLVERGAWLTIYDTGMPSFGSLGGMFSSLACSVQVALEDALLYLIQRLRDLSSSENLCYAGGVALNSIANERIIRESGFKNVYIMPAAEDSGPAIGAAYYGLWQLTEHNSVRKMVHDACGRLYSLHSSLSALERHQDFKVARSTDVISDTVDLLCDRKIIGGLLGGRSLGQELWGSGAYFATRAALKLKQS